RSVVLIAQQWLDFLANLAADQRQKTVTLVRAHLPQDVSAFVRRKSFQDGAGELRGKLFADAWASLERWRIAKRDRHVERETGNHITHFRQLVACWPRPPFRECEVPEKTRVTELRRSRDSLRPPHALSCTPPRLGTSTRDRCDLR